MKTIYYIIFLLCFTLPALSAELKISWTPPTENTDGTPLTNLLGYRINYGTSKDNLDKSINTPRMAEWWKVKGLTSGVKYYFTVSAVNYELLSSAPSDMVSKVAQDKPSSPSMICEGK